MVELFNPIIDPANEHELLFDAYFSEMEACARLEQVIKVLFTKIASMNTNAVQSIEATCAAATRVRADWCTICEPRVVRQHTYRQKQTFTFDAPQRQVFGGQRSVAI